MKKIILLLALIIISQIVFSAEETPIAKNLEDKLKAFDGLEIYVDSDISKDVTDFGYDIDLICNLAYKKLDDNKIYKKDKPDYILISLYLQKGSDNCTNVVTTIDIYKNIQFKGVDGKTYETDVKYYSFTNTDLYEKVPDTKEARADIISDTIQYIDKTTDKIIAAYKKSHK